MMRFVYLSILERERFCWCQRFNTIKQALLTLTLVCTGSTCVNEQYYHLSAFVLAIVCSIAITQSCVEQAPVIQSRISVDNSVEDLASKWCIPFNSYSE